MGYGWITDGEIRTRSTNGAYQKGSAYYRDGAVSSASRGMVVPYAGASRERDCISATVRELGPPPRRAGGGKDGSYLVRVYAMGVTLCDCQGEPRDACRHTVAAMLHIVDNLEEMGAESPRWMGPMRRKRGDEGKGYDDITPAAYFERMLIRHRGDARKARADLKFVARMLGDYTEYRRYEWMPDMKPARRDLSKARAQFTAYMSYMQRLMIRHTDTPQKKIKYVRYLADNLEQAPGKFAAGVYEDAMTELARRGAEWLTYVANAARAIGAPSFLFEEDPDLRNSLLEKIAKL